MIKYRRLSTWRAIGNCCGRRRARNDRLARTCYIRRMPLIELRYQNKMIAKVATAMVGTEPGDKVRFLILGEIPALDRLDQYTLVIEGASYALKNLQLQPDGKSIVAILE